MKEKLKLAICEELQIDPAELTRDRQLDDFEAWDSVTALTVMILISEETGVPVLPHEIKVVKTFGDIEKLVKYKKRFREETDAFLDN